jgi:hypothetical protein
MDKTEALKAIRIFINVASRSDDIDAIYKVLREMRGIVNNALPPVRRKKGPKAVPTRPSLKVVE